MTSLSQAYLPKFAQNPISPADESPNPEVQMTPIVDRPTIFYYVNYLPHESFGRRDQ